MSLKRDLLFARENVVPIDLVDSNTLPPIDNIIISTVEPELKWLEESTKRIGAWRDVVRSCYIRWAISINGLHVAHSKYKDPTWKARNQFKVGCFQSKNGRLEMSNMVVWDGDTAADAHIKTVQMLASYGLIDLYSVVEEMLLSFYRVYKECRPEQFIVGKDNRALRSLYAKRDTDPEAWEREWSQRLDKWQRSKIYDGIHTILLGYYSVTGLKNPSTYKMTSPETWAESLRAVAILRNCLVHGTKQVPKELAEISTKAHALGFKFIEGQPIELDTVDLMKVELFAEQLLTAFNQSMAEYYEEALRIKMTSNPPKS